LSDGEAGLRRLFRLAREHLLRKLTEKKAGARFELVAPPDGGLSQLVIRYRPIRLTDAPGSDSQRKSLA
jgi:hypothetical protein